VDPDAGDSGSETQTPRRSPVKFLYVVAAVLGVGMAALWSPWGLLLVSVGAVVGLVLLKAKGSAPDMDEERHRLDQLQEDLTWLRDSAEHPDGSVHDRLRGLEVLHRYGRISGEDYATQRAQIVRMPPDQGRPVDGLDAPG
jgi:hypothetical protein